MATRVPGVCFGAGGTQGVLWPAMRSNWYKRQAGSKMCAYLAHSPGALASGYLPIVCFGGGRGIGPGAVGLGNLSLAGGRYAGCASTRWGAPWGCLQAGNRGIGPGAVGLGDLSLAGFWVCFGPLGAPWGRLQAGQGCVFVFICCMLTHLTPPPPWPPTRTTHTEPGPPNKTK